MIELIPYEESLKDSILSGEKIMLFLSFPTEQLPNMARVRIEKLTEAEKKLYEGKTIYIQSWREVSFEGVNKFLVVKNASLYLVRIFDET